MKEKKTIKLRIINCKTEFKLTETKDEGKVLEAYVSIFNNVDSYGDIIVKGAFAESIKKKLPVGAWAHNWDEPIAKTLEAREDDKGLYIKAKFVEGVQRADEAYALIKEGVITEFSIGFSVLEDESNDAGNRILKKIKLYEWSPVLAGANSETEVISIKSAEIKAEEEEAKEEEEEEKKKAEELRVKITELQKDIQSFKDGRVLSEKNRALVQEVVDGLDGLSANISNLITPLKDLLSATEPKGELKVVPTPEANKKIVLRIRQVLKQADKTNEVALRLIKKL